MLSVGKALDGAGGTVIRPLGKPAVGMAFGLSAANAAPATIDIRAAEGSRNAFVDFSDPTVFGAIEAGGVLRTST